MNSIHKVKNMTALILCCAVMTACGSKDIPAPSRTRQPGGGVELSAIGDSEECDAYKLADKYMSQYYPEWYARYPIILKDYDKLTKTTDENAVKFSWYVTGENGGLTDPEGYRNMTPEEVLEDLFKDAGLSE